MPSFSISSSNVLPESLWVSAEFLLLSTGPKYAGVQRDAIPWLWVSNRGEKHPCWHTILLAKSSVLYLLRPPHFAEMHWKGAVPRQTDTFRRQQNRRILWTESYKRQEICYEQNPAVRV